MSRQPAVSRFRVRHGQGSASAPNLLSVADVPQRPPLYLLVETGGDDQLASTITFAADDAYRRTRGSLTGALQAVVRAAGNALRQSPRAQGGLSALVVQKDEALLAQVEPAACWLLRDGQLMRWPMESVWLDAGASDSTLRHMTGGLGHADADLSRITLHAGDKLLLGTTSVARDVGELLIAEAMAEADPGAALHRLAPDVDFAAIGVEPFGGPVGHPASLRDAQPARVTERLSVKPSAPAIAASGSQPAPRVPAAGEAPAATNKQPVIASAPIQPLRSGLTFATPRPPAGEAPRRAFRVPSIDLRPYLEVVALATLFIFKVFGMIARGMWAIMKRALPDRESVTPRAAPTVRKPTFNSNPFENTSLRIVAFAIPVLLAIGVAVLISRSSAENAARYDDLVKQADSAYQAALAGADGTARRAALEKAARFIDDALKIQSTDGSLRDPRAKDLQTLIGKELDGLNKATTFFYYPLLFEFAEAGSRPTVVAARGNEVYVLDSGLHRLYKFLLNETRDQLQPAPTRMPTPAPTPNPVVMRQGDERGAIVVGEMADIFWGTAGAGRTSTGLLTLTAQKQVVEYVPARGINVLAVAAVPGWEEATLGESFNGNLYVLDAKANRILKFAPTGEDFRTPPVDYVTSGLRVDFGGATGMAVDGFVWVLLADGTIMKFDGGNPVAFDKRGLDTPLKKTVAIVAQPNSPSLWVADAGNRRIVQFNKTGEYVRQYKPDDPRVMSDLRGFAVDEAAKRFYWVNGTRLYLGTLQN